MAKLVMWTFKQLKIPYFYQALLVKKTYKQILFPESYLG